MSSGRCRTILNGHRRQNRQRRPLEAVARDKSDPYRLSLEPKCQQQPPATAWWESSDVENGRPPSSGFRSPSLSPISDPMVRRPRRHVYSSARRPGPGAYLRLHRAPLRPLPSSHRICWRWTTRAVPMSAPNPASTSTPAAGDLLTAILRHRNDPRHVRYPAKCVEIFEDWIKGWEKRLIRKRDRLKIFERSRQRIYQFMSHPDDPII